MVRRAASGDYDLATAKPPQVRAGPAQTRADPAQPREHDAGRDSIASTPYRSEAVQQGILPAKGPDSRWQERPLSALAADGPDIPWIFNGYLTPGAVTLFTGLWKAGKTTFLAYLLAVLDGSRREFAGHTIRAARVLLITEESERMWADRRDQLYIGDHVDIICRPFLTRPSSTMWQRFIQRITQRIFAKGYTLVVFDSLPNLWPVADENAAPDVLNALTCLNSLVEAGVAVLLVAHPRKGDAGEGQATRGSGAIASFVDVIVEMRRYDPERRDDTRRVLTAYSRYDDTPPELVVQFDPHDGHTAIGSKAEVKAGDRLAAAMDCLPSQPPGMLVDDILAVWPNDAAGPRPSRKTIVRDLDRAAGIGVQKTGTGHKGDPYRYYRAPRGEAVQHDSMPDSSPPIGDQEKNSTPGAIPAAEGTQQRSRCNVELPSALSLEHGREVFDL